MSSFIERYRRVFFFTGLAWFALLLIVGLVVSQLEAKEGLHVFGGAQWRAGQPTAVRVGLRVVRRSQFQHAPPLEGQLLDTDGTALGVAFPIANYQGPFVTASINPPKAGMLTLKITGTGQHGPVKAEVPIEVAEAFTPLPLPVPKARKKRPPTDHGPIHLDVFPADHAVPGDLPTVLAFRALDASGAPRRVSLKPELKRAKSTRLALPSSLKTDRLGLAWAPIWSAHPELEFTLTTEQSPQPDGAEGPPDRSLAKRTLVDTPTQFTLDVGNPIREAGGSIGATVRSLHKRGAVFIDVYLEGRWHSTHGVELNTGEGQAVVPLPESLPHDPALAWVQAYRDPYQPGRARGGRWLLLTQKPAHEAAKALMTRLKAAGVEVPYIEKLTEAGLPGPGDEAQRLTRYLLGRLKRPEANPPLLADSGKSAQLQVDMLRAAWMQRMVLALVISGCVLFIVVGLLLWRNAREVREGFQALDTAEDGEEALDPGLVLAATRGRLQWGAVYMLGVLVTFIIALVQLLSTISW
ncbi:MAG: hypothetical protein ACE366_29040 [Bradymonadia bacterium]